MVTWQIAVYGAITLALMSLFMVGRHTRAEEESGRAELLRSTVVGRHAAITAVLLVMAAANLAVALLVTLTLLPVGLGVAGSFALGAGMAGCGLVFGGVAAVTAQLSENTHAASGLAGALLGLAFVLRAAGDVGNGVLTWLSPIGWTEMVQPYTGERWWVLGLFVAAFGLEVALAFVLASRRDVGAGFAAARPGPPAAPASLLRPAGLAWRLGRATVAAWAFGLFVLGVAYGSVGNDLEDLIGGSEGVRDFIAAPGAGSLTDQYWVTTCLHAGDHHRRLRGDGHAAAAHGGVVGPGRARAGGRRAPAGVDGRLPGRGVRGHGPGAGGGRRRARAWPTASPWATSARWCGWPAWRWPTRRRCGCWWG